MVKKRRRKSPRMLRFLQDPSLNENTTESESDAGKTQLVLPVSQQALYNPPTHYRVRSPLLPPERFCGFVAPLLLLPLPIPPPPPFSISRYSLQSLQSSLFSIRLLLIVLLMIRFAFD